MLYGRTNAAMPSRFIKELPESDIERKGGYSTPARFASYSTPGYGGYKPSPAKPNYTAPSAPKKVAMIELSKGDMVQHAAFGRGLVLSVMNMGSDALLEIAFDQIGTKKLLAKAASAHMKKL
jgi:DNA helicase-2/ATP-dependent DNA helicase PcrA